MAGRLGGGLAKGVGPVIISCDVTSQEWTELRDSEISYDVHIVRAGDWLDAAADPITKPHIDELIASDPELAWSTEDYADMGDGHEKNTTRYFMIPWNGSGIAISFSAPIQAKGKLEKWSRWQPN